MEQTLAICEECDAVHKRRPLPHGERAYCMRCGAQLYVAGKISVDRLLALTVGGLVIFLIANSTPILAIELGAEGTHTTLLGAIGYTSKGMLIPLAILAALTLFVFPLMQLLASLYVLLPLRNGLRPKHFSGAMYALRLMRPWSMTEVFMLGILVSLVKLLATYTVVVGVSAWAFLALTMILTIIGSTDLHELWDLASNAREMGW